jgi:hypothetical protein
MTPSTRSPRKRAAKANGNLISRLRQVKAQPMPEITDGETTWTAQELRSAEQQIIDLTKEAERVTVVRQSLLECPSIVLPGAILL